ncbi:hypothetical protein [Shewanella sp. HN-41]|uniref:hypothetical protein n=1 Tax=Shewanella sp. HN-41 TaxID=327275 RepID=UPI0005608D15|nr:hypothetical protein [Shewanella sp. HN-41]
MNFNIAVLPIMILMILGIGSMFLAMNLLSREVSREKLHKVEDLSSLWKTSFPPAQVLTERGLKIQKWFRAFIVILVLSAAVLGLFVTGFSNTPIITT